MDMKKLNLFFTGLWSVLAVPGQAMPVLADASKVTPDSVQLIFAADDLYGTGMIGYQLLLDADHDSYGRLFDPSNEEFTRPNYSGFEYLVPRNATPSDNTSVVLDGADTIMIPAGKYDYVILSPRPGGVVFYLGGDFSAQDDFVFAGGHSYRLYVRSEGVVFQADADLALTGLVLPGNSADLTASELISVDIVNRGNAPVGNFPVCFSVDGGTPVRETVSDEIAVGDTLHYTFTAPVDLSAEGLRQVKVWTAWENDVLAFNDTVEGQCMHIAVASLPYTYAFSSAEDFVWDWTTLNANGDWLEWGIYDWQAGANGEDGHAVCNARNVKSNDWLISNPIALGAGENHILFYMYDDKLNTVPGYGEGTGIVEVFYGHSTDTASMESLGVFTVEDEAWRQKVVNFEVEEAGDYHVAFKAMSEPACTLFFDEVSVDAGHYALAPQIEVQEILVPLTTCNFSIETPVGLRIANVGMGAAAGIDIAYSVNDGTEVRQEYGSVVEAGDVVELWFDSLADLSEIGRYELHAVAGVEGQYDSVSKVVYHYDILNDYPVLTHFSLDQQIEDVWSMVTDGSWEYEQIGSCYTSMATGMENGLLSHCFHMEGEYRVELAYSGGGMGYSSSFLVLFGEAGSDTETWDTVYSASEITTTHLAEFGLSAPVASEYNLLIVNTSENVRAPFRLLDFGLYQREEHDAAIEQVVSPLAKYMPQSQLTGEMRYEATVRNMGLATLHDLRLYVVSQGDTLFRSSAGIELDSGAVTVLAASGMLPALETGESLSLEMVVQAREADGYTQDNRHVLSATVVTDSVYAMEDVHDMEQGIGQTGEAFCFGNLYTLTLIDTLTSLTYALNSNESAESYAQTVGLAVFRLQEDALLVGQEIFSVEFPRPSEAGFYTLVLPAPRVLEPGRYYFEFRQLTENNAGVLYEEDANGICYSRSGDSLTAMNYGINLAIRANFASGARVFQKDVAVVEITAPIYDSALFSRSEKVVAVIENNGLDSVSNMEVSCGIGSQVKTFAVSLASYEKKEVRFEGFDMYEAGTYTATVSTALEGDENVLNNTLERVWFCHALQDPAWLDFELANDFDTAVFNREWQSFDLAGVTTDAFWQFNWPGRMQPVGFMVFNIASTYPAMTEDLNVPGFEPYEGRRFGAAFAPFETSEEMNADTWIVSPQVELGQNPGFEFYVRSLPGYEEEPFQLWVSESGSEIGDFVMLGAERTAPDEWTKVSVSLAEYAGKSIYVALQYVGGGNNVCLLVDNLHVLADGLSDEVDETADKAVSLVQHGDEVLVSSPVALREVKVFNMSGPCMLSRVPLNQSRTEFSVSGWASGLYLCRVYLQDGSVVCLKFVKK